jgi:hypothetical protein
MADHWYSPSRALMRRFCGWLAWYGSAATHWRALPPRRLRRRRPIEALAFDDLAEPMVSEMITNAFRYGRPPIVLTLRLDGMDRLVIEVSDGDPTPPMSRSPSEDGGFGMSILHGYADVTVVACATSKIVRARLKPDA